MNGITCSKTFSDISKASFRISISAGLFICLNSETSFELKISAFGKALMIA
jgi:hypothetical protein